MSIVNQIVNRCHVGQSNRQVINYVVSRLANQRQTYFALDKATRRKLLAEIIAAHDANRSLYGFVMSGGHGYTGKTKRRKKR